MTEVAQPSMFPELPVTGPPAATVDDRTPGERLRDRRVALVAAGYHPLANVIPGLKLLSEPGGRTCGTCARLERHSRNRTYLKCELWPSHSDASDVRMKWPACGSWQSAEA